MEPVNVPFMEELFAGVIKLRSLMWDIIMGGSRWVHLKSPYKREVRGYLRQKRKAM